MPSIVMPQTGSVVADRYELHDLLGESRFSVVFVARDHAPLDLSGVTGPTGCCMLGYGSREHANMPDV